jgi:putative ABC transport system permease protein
VGIYNTGQSTGDGGAMLPLASFQGSERKTGTVTLAFVRVAPGFKIATVRQDLERQNPSLASVQFLTEFGRVDRTLFYLDAAETGATLLALIVGTIIVMNAMLLSLVERTREFGVLRAVGWTRRRLWALILGEALVISLLGAAAGVALSFGVVMLLEALPELEGYLRAQFSTDTFWRALYTAALIGVIAAVYPALRAGALKPLAALRRE